MDLGLQAGNDLHLFCCVLVLLPINLWCLGPALLLSLARFDPLLHGQVLTKACQVVFLEAKALEQGAVLDRVEDDMIVWPA